MRKTVFCVLMMTLLLAGCGGEKNKEISAEERAVQLRTQYLAASECAGTAVVTADYGERVYGFTLDFSWMREGDTVLTVTAPEELAGLSATVGSGGSRLEFQGLSLGTGDLTGEGLTPLEFLPAVMTDIDSGFMAECSFETQEDRETLRVLFRDPEEEAQEGLERVLWFDRDTGALLRAELSYRGELVIRSDFVAFELMEKQQGNAAEK